MLLVARVREPACLPAVTHVDGTVRLQTVERDVDERYWELHRAFARKTGVSVLLNTSFNVKGEPIVCTPDDAIQCLLKTEIDHLVIGPCIVDRPPSPAIFVETGSRDPVAPVWRIARWIGALRDGILYCWFFVRSWGLGPDRARRVDYIV
jgi:hypothetical protein